VVARGFSYLYNARASGRCGSELHDGGAEEKGTTRITGSESLVRLIGIIAGIIAVPLSIYLFVAGERSRELTYYVNPTTTTIVKNGQSSDIHRLYRDQPVTSDLTAR